MAVGIRTPNLPQGNLIEVIGHADAGGGARTAARMNVGDFVNLLLGLATGDASAVASLAGRVQQIAIDVSSEGQARREAVDGLDEKIDLNTAALREYVDERADEGGDVRARDVALLNTKISESIAALREYVDDRADEGGYVRAQDVANLNRKIDESVGALRQNYSERIGAEADLRAKAVTALDNKVSSTTAALQRGLDDEITALLAALAEKAPARDVDALASLVDALSAQVIAQRFDFTRDLTRPGEARAAFALTASLADLAGPRDFVPVLPARVIVPSDVGLVAQISGAGIVGMRRAIAIEPGRLYRARFVVQRRANPSDPSGDAVRAVVLWLDQTFAQLSGSGSSVVIKDWDRLTTGLGRQEVQTLYSRSPSPDRLVVAPDHARYAVAAIQIFGLDGVTSVEVLDIEDVSLATVLEPVSSDTVARVAAIESSDLPDRVSAIEIAQQAPNSLTFATRTDAASAQIPASVTTVETRGRVTAGDGGGGLYARVAGALPPGADGFVSGGGSWKRVVMAQEAFNALLTAGFVGWMDSLPKAQPDQPGLPYNNGGLPAVSGRS